MAKKIKFALKMKDDVEVRSLAELQWNFDLNSVMTYFVDGRLEQWLQDRYYDDLADAIGALDTKAPDCKQKLCELFGVEYENNTLSIEEIEERNRKIEKLKGITDDAEIIRNVDSVAFKQEELADLLDEGRTTIYLYGQDFSIPKRKKGITYIGIETKLKISEEELKAYDTAGIQLVNLVDKADERKTTQLSNYEGPLFLCRTYDGEKILAYVTDIRKKNKHEDLLQQIPYYVPVVKVKGLDGIEIKSAYCNGSKILYWARDEKGDFVGTVNGNGSDNKLIKRVDDDVFFFKEYFLVKTKHIYDRYEKIYLDGRTERVYLSHFSPSSPNVIETKTGIYEICIISYNSIMIDELLNGAEKDRRLTDDKVITESHHWKIVNVQAVEEDIYILGVDINKNHIIYIYNTLKGKVTGKIKLRYEIIDFCIHENRLVCIENSYPDHKNSIVSFDLQGKDRKNIYEYKNISRGLCSWRSVKGLKSIGEYIYLFWGSTGIECMIRFKVDGSGMEEVGKNSSFSQSFARVFSQISSLYQEDCKSENGKSKGELALNELSEIKLSC